MEAEQVLAKINNSGLDSRWKKYARAALRLDSKNITEKNSTVVGEPASSVADDQAHWGRHKEVAQILYDRDHTFHLYNLEGLRRRPYTHTYENRRWGNPIVWVRFEYCLEDARAIRERWNSQRPNNRGKSWKEVANDN